MAHPPGRPALPRPPRPPGAVGSSAAVRPPGHERLGQVAAAQAQLGAGRTDLPVSCSDEQGQPWGIVISCGIAAGKPRPGVVRGMGCGGLAEAVERVSRRRQLVSISWCAARSGPAQFLEGSPERQIPLSSHDACHRAQDDQPRRAGTAPKHDARQRAVSFRCRPVRSARTGCQHSGCPAAAHVAMATRRGLGQFSLMAAGGVAAGNEPPGR
jgi:hypothetical protein